MSRGLRLCVLAAVLVACQVDTEPLPPPRAQVFVGASNVGDCTRNADERTALLVDSLVLDTLPVTVFIAGDEGFPDGTVDDFRNCYEPGWGRHKARTIPTPGNHEYQTPDASGYFDYFGAKAGPRGQGYYSFNLGAWHIVVLNSNDDYVSTRNGSPQVAWLQADLKRANKRCTLAVWHHPRFFSTQSPTPGGSDRPNLEPFWYALYAAGAEIIVTGDSHFYERFAPQTPEGAVDRARGVRQFSAGTGGAGDVGVPTSIRANSEAVNGATLGVLKLTLDTDRYAWQFVHVPGATFTDSGSDTCH